MNVVAYLPVAVCIRRYWTEAAYQDNPDDILEVEARSVVDFGRNRPKLLILSLQQMVIIRLDQAIQMEAGGSLLIRRTGSFPYKSGYRIHLIGDYHD